MFIFCSLKDAGCKYEHLLQIAAALANILPQRCLQFEEVVDPMSFGKAIQYQATCNNVSVEVFHDLICINSDAAV